MGGNQGKIKEGKMKGKDAQHKNWAVQDLPLLRTITTKKNPSLKNEDIHSYHYYPTASNNSLVLKGSDYRPNYIKIFRK